jgi:hypothetical protein
MRPHARKNACTIETASLIGPVALLLYFPALQSLRFCYLEVEATAMTAEIMDVCNVQYCGE